MDTPPPPELVEFLSTVLVHDMFISETRVCSSENTVPVWSETTGDFYCACVGELCIATDSTSTWTIILVVTVMVLAVILVAFVVWAFLGLRSIKSKVLQQQYVALD
jgi:uncharacterized protein (DUF983 family)